MLGFFCNIFVYIAVEGYKTFPLALGKYLAIFVGITVFIMSGYEHSVADMFYYFMAGRMDPEALVRLLVITAGNVCGGWAAWGAGRRGNGLPGKIGDRGGFPGAFLLYSKYILLRGR